MKSNVFLVMLLSMSMNVFAIESSESVSAEQQSSNLKGRVVKVKVDESSGDCVLSGKVTDEKGDPIIGAVIVNKATKKGVVTDLNGMYKMSVQKGAIVEVMYAGYRKTVVKLGKKASQEVNIVLKQDNTNDSQKLNDTSKKKSELGLVLVDGEIYEKPLDEIPTEKIEKMTVVKYKKDLVPYIEKYGEKASDGVILIALKK